MNNVFYILFPTVLISGLSFVELKNKNERLIESVIKDTCRTVEMGADFSLIECFYGSGKIRSRTFVRNARTWGNMEEYHENGSLAMIGQAYYGVKQGMFILFDSTGTVRQTTEYKVYNDLQPMNEAKYSVDAWVDTLTGDLIEVTTMIPGREMLHGASNFYNGYGVLDSIQYWRNDTLYQTYRAKIN